MSSETQPTARLQRRVFKTSRLLDFCSTKELVAQTGHDRDEWPLVVVKELIDNALDACEDGDIAPTIELSVDLDGITVADNGPGIPVETIDGVLDFAVRASSREAYVSPCRGAQGNALKTIIPMPFVLSGGDKGSVDVAAHGVCHRLTFSVDRIRQEPVVNRSKIGSDVRIGTTIRVHWPDTACSILTDAESRILQLAEDFAVLNPHMALDATVFGHRIQRSAIDPGWRKWKPSMPTCPHWYELDHFERLIGAYLSADAQSKQPRSVREFVAEFRGLTGTAKQKQVLADTGLAKAPLEKLVVDGDFDHRQTASLLESMKRHCKSVKPDSLGFIGKDNVAARFESAGCDMDSFTYDKKKGVDDGLPWVIETAFGCMRSDDARRRLVTGVNWSPGIGNPFRKLGRFGRSCDTVLAELKLHQDDPVVLLIHMACPRVSYLDRGKSGVVLS